MEGKDLASQIKRFGIDDSKCVCVLVSLAKWTEIWGCPKIVCVFVCTNVVCVLPLEECSGMTNISLWLSNIVVYV